MNGMKEMFIRFPGNLLENSEEFFHFNIFRWMFEKISENFRKDFGECSRRFCGMFKKIPGNVTKD